MKKRIAVIAAAIFIALACIAQLLNTAGILPSVPFSSKLFGITTVLSPVDFNNNGTDDYSDFVAGARLDAKNRPTYDGSYHEGGYPPDDIGVCTDVVWRAFKYAGYSLKDMVDKDVEAALEEYFHIETPDPNIDFRRVKKSEGFFLKDTLNP